MFDENDHFIKFLKYVNTRHGNIKLTVEEEQDNKIFFLDISTARVGNELTNVIIW